MPATKASGTCNRVAWHASYLPNMGGGMKCRQRTITGPTGTQNLDTAPLGLPKGPTASLPVSSVTIPAANRNGANQHGGLSATQPNHSDVLEYEHCSAFSRLVAVRLRRGWRHPLQRVRDPLELHPDPGCVLAVHRGLLDGAGAEHAGQVDGTRRLRHSLSNIARRAPGPKMRLGVQKGLHSACERFWGLQVVLIEGKV